MENEGNTARGARPWGAKGASVGARSWGVKGASVGARSWGAKGASVGARSWGVKGASVGARPWGVKDAADEARGKRGAGAAHAQSPGRKLPGARRGRRGSLTVEATLVLPLFLFGVLFLLYFFQILFLMDSVQEAITETGKFFSRYAGLEGERDGGTELAHAALLHERFLEFLDGGNILTSCVKGGLAGITLGQSSICEEGDEIDIVAAYQIRIAVPLLGERSALIRQRSRTRAFVGKRLGGQGGDASLGGEGEDDDDFIVYVTETGDVYHMSEDCSHLRLSITQVRAEDLATERNEDGGKYKPCEKCARGQAPGSGETVYVAREGDRYHRDLGCSGLKRTVYAVRYSTVKDRRRCARCG